jgi:ribokinase
VTPRPRVAVVGSANVDHVVRCAALPRPGETVLGEDVALFAGGKGANQAAALARLGVDVTLIAAVGEDASGEWLASRARDLGVDVSWLQRSSRPTGAAFITVDRHGENEIVVSPGANADLDPSGIDLATFEVVLAQLEVPLPVVDDAARRSRTLVLNAAPASAVAPETLGRCAVVIANEREAASLDLASLACCVVTLGALGAVAYEHGREVARAVPPPVEVVDTVGAGDVFCAAYTAQFSWGASPKDALRFAVAAGALATRDVGAQGALPTRDEVERWLERAS